MAALEREYAEMQAADAGASTAALASERAEAERLKSLAVANQKRLYERILGLRILMQRPLTASHRLPSESTRSTVCAGEAASSTGMARSYQACEEACRGVLSELLQVQNMLITRNPAVVQVRCSSFGFP